MFFWNVNTKTDWFWNVSRNTDVFFEMSTLKNDCVLKYEHFKLSVLEMWTLNCGIWNLIGSIVWSWLFEICLIDVILFSVCCLKFGCWPNDGLYTVSPPTRLETDWKRFWSLKFDNRKIQCVNFFLQLASLWFFVKTDLNRLFVKTELKIKQLFYQTLFIQLFLNQNLVRSAVYELNFFGGKLEKKKCDFQCEKH